MIPASARKAAPVSPRRDAWPVRAFIGIPLPAEGQEAVAGLQDYLRALPPFSEFRWVPPGNVHITLRFLGDISGDEAAAASTALASGSAGGRAFSFPLDRLGAFPRAENPSVLWAGPMEPPPALVSLAENLQSALVRAGFPAEERPFRPHLTLARRRRKKRPPRGLAAALREADEARPGPCPVLRMSEAALIQSDLRPGGVVYTPLHTAILIDE